MKFSEVIVDDLISYAREDKEDPEVIKLFETILISCKSYIKNYTGLTFEEMEDKEDLVIPLMVLANEMYENRLFTLEDKNVNKLIKGILDMHSVNYL